jgi:hypothetical protein
MNNRMAVLAATLLALGAGNALAQSQAAGGQLEHCKGGIARCSSTRCSPPFRCCAC